MNWQKELEGVDIYLIDQILKNRIKPDARILDAGCGKGRNIRPFLENGFSCVGIDPDISKIDFMKENFPDYIDSFSNVSIEDYKDEIGFDFILCNAVLHFAKNDSHFDKMFSKLISLINPGGSLFIRMTSNIGMDHTLYPSTGVYVLPDNSTRYLITRARIDALIDEYSLNLLDPVKSTLVENLRSMTTIVLGKQ